MSTLSKLSATKAAAVCMMVVKVGEYAKRRKNVLFPDIVQEVVDQITNDPDGVLLAQLIEAAEHNLHYRKHVTEDLVMNFIIDKYNRIIKERNIVYNNPNQPPVGMFVGVDAYNSPVDAYGRPATFAVVNVQTPHGLQQQQVPIQEYIRMMNQRAAAQAPMYNTQPYNPAPMAPYATTQPPSMPAANNSSSPLLPPMNSGASARVIAPPPVHGSVDPVRAAINDANRVANEAIRVSYPTAVTPHVPAAGPECVPVAPPIPKTKRNNDMLVLMTKDNDPSVVFRNGCPFEIHSETTYTLSDKSFTMDRAQMKHVTNMAFANGHAAGQFIQAYIDEQTKTFVPRLITLPYVRATHAMRFVDNEVKVVTNGLRNRLMSASPDGLIDTLESSSTSAPMKYLIRIALAAYNAYCNTYVNTTDFFENRMTYRARTISGVSGIIKQNVQAILNEMSGYDNFDDRMRNALTVFITALTEPEFLQYKNPYHMQAIPSIPGYHTVESTHGLSNYDMAYAIPNENDEESVKVSERYIQYLERFLVPVLGAVAMYYTKPLVEGKDFTRRGEALVLTYGVMSTPLISLMSQNLCPYWTMTFPVQSALSGEYDVVTKSICHTLDNELVLVDEHPVIAPLV